MSFAQFFTFLHDEALTVVKKPYNLRRMTPASAYWHYLKSFCAFGIPGIEPLYLSVETRAHLANIYNAPKSQQDKLYNETGRTVLYIRQWYTPEEFVAHLNGNPSYVNLLRNLFSQAWNLTALTPPMPDHIKNALAFVHEQFAPVREELNQA